MDGPGQGYETNELEAQVAAQYEDEVDRYQHTSNEPQPELVDPQEVAVYLSEVWKDPEVSNFERLSAASGLMNFWSAMEFSRLSDLLTRVEAT